MQTTIYIYFFKIFVYCWVIDLSRNLIKVMNVFRENFKKSIPGNGANTIVIVKRFNESRKNYRNKLSSLHNSIYRFDNFEESQTVSLTQSKFLNKASSKNISKKMIKMTNKYNKSIRILEKIESQRMLENPSKHHKMQKANNKYKVNFPFSNQKINKNDQKKTFNLNAFNQSAKQVPVSKRENDIFQISTKEVNDPSTLLELQIFQQTNKTRKNQNMPQKAFFPESLNPSHNPSMNTSMITIEEEDLKKRVRKHSFKKKNNLVTDLFNHEYQQFEDTNYQTPRHLPLDNFGKDKNDERNTENDKLFSNEMGYKGNEEFTATPDPRKIRKRSSMCKRLSLERSIKFEFEKNNNGEWDISAHSKEKEIENSASKIFQIKSKAKFLEDIDFGISNVQQSNIKKDSVIIKQSTVIDNIVDYSLKETPEQEFCINIEDGQFLTEDENGVDNKKIPVSKAKGSEECPAFGPDGI